jgi:hypothetical protein
MPVNETRFQAAGCMVEITDAKPGQRVGPTASVLIWAMLRGSA